MLMDLLLSMYLAYGVILCFKVFNMVDLKEKTQELNTPVIILIFGYIIFSFMWPIAVFMVIYQKVMNS